MPSSRPMQIRNKFYQNLREFTAWSPWGERPPHTNDNTGYIPIANLFVKRLNYPAEMQKLINYGWRSSSKPTSTPMAFTAAASGASLTERKRAGLMIGRAAIPGLNGRSAIGRPSMPPPPARPTLKTAMGGRLEADWNHITLFEQVGAYTFRGDTRSPESIMASGGFQPPSMRTDDHYVNTMAEEFANYIERRDGVTLDPQVRTALELEVQGYIRNQPPVDRKMFTEYHFWRQVLTNQQMHLRSMTNNSFLKAYISTTRDIKKAWEGASGSLGGEGVVQTVGATGWIYVLRVKSGFLLKTGVGGVSKKEAEVSHLGPLEWKNVYGFLFRGDKSTVYIRNMFDQQDYNAFKQVLGALSNPI